MDKNRLWMIGSVVVMGAVVVLGFMLGIKPQFDAISTADEARVSVETSNAQQAAVLAKLKDDFAGIDTLRAELAPLNDSVPTGTEMPKFVDQLSALAGESHVSLTAITVADAEAYAPVIAPVVAAPAGSSATPTPTPTPSDTAAPAVAPVPVAGVPPVVDPRITAGNFASLAVQISIKGDYANVLDFVNGLQTGKRLFLVSGLSTVAASTTPSTATSTTTTPTAKGGVDATISGLVYVLVASAKASAPAAG